MLQIVRGNHWLLLTMSFTFKTLNLKKQSWIIILNTNDCMVKLTRDDAKTDNKQQQLAVSATPSETAICQCYHCRKVGRRVGENAESQTWVANLMNPPRRLVSNSAACVRRAASLPPRRCCPYPLRWDRPGHPRPVASKKMLTSMIIRGLAKSQWKKRCSTEEETPPARNYSA